MDLASRLGVVFPTLFSKTFFILTTQLFITWLTTNLVFLFFKKIDPKLESENPYVDKPENEDVFQHIAEETSPEYRWVFSKALFYSIMAAWIGLFLVLMFWGIYQPLAVSFALFTIWSVLMGVQLEYVLLNVEEGLGRKVLALTATIVFGACCLGAYSHINFGFLQIPLFIALSILVVINLFQVFGSMSEVKQRITAGFGVIIFTLYLVYDFYSLVVSERLTGNTWPNAMRFTIKIYLDIINLFLQLLKLLGKHHH